MKKVTNAQLVTFQKWLLNVGGGQTSREILVLKESGLLGPFANLFIERFSQAIPQNSSMTPHKATEPKFRVPI